jgi:pimeloyl-ACP methyl ester carboxylesterase
MGVFGWAAVLLGGGIALALGAGYWVLTRGVLLTPLAALEAEFKRADSRFIDIDGLRVHYLDSEPEAGPERPVAVLLHASFMDLASWDGLAAALAPTHRVVRMDFVGHGLTGSETGGKNMFALNEEIVDRLTRTLGIASFDLVATSSGGTVGFRFAAHQPERVKRLVLINSAGLPRTPATDPNRVREDAVSAYIRRFYRTRESWVVDLKRNFPSLETPPEAVLARMHAMNNRERPRVIGGGNPAVVNNETEKLLPKVKAPTLILWGEANATVDFLQAEVFQHWLTEAPSAVIRYRGLGHYPYLEAPDIVLPDIVAFVNGRMDDRLRRVRAEPYVAAGAAVAP